MAKTKPLLRSVLLLSAKNLISAKGNSADAVALPGLLLNEFNSF